jgi:hypothetical protein
MTPKIIIRVFSGFLFLWVTLFASCGHTMNLSQAEGKSPASRNEQSSSLQHYRSLLTRAETVGSVRIIARLNMPFVPDGHLSSQAAVDQQKRIASMQDQLCADLSEYQVRGVKRMKYAPFIGMEVDAKALRMLISHPLILSLQEDAPVPPAGR